MKAIENCEAASSDEAGGLPGFEPVAVLWEGKNAPYPSEASARWDLQRGLRDELSAERALAVHRGRLLVHRERMAAVLENRAIAAAQRRHKG